MEFQTLAFGGDFTEPCFHDKMCMTIANLLNSSGVTVYVFVPNHHEMEWWFTSCSPTTNTVSPDVKSLAKKTTAMQLLSGHSQSMHVCIWKHETQGSDMAPPCCHCCSSDLKICLNLSLKCGACAPVWGTEEHSSVYHVCIEKQMNYKILSYLMYTLFSLNTRTRLNSCCPLQQLLWMDIERLKEISVL